MKKVACLFILAIFLLFSYPNQVSATIVTLHPDAYTIPSSLQLKADRYSGTHLETMRAGGDDTDEKIDMAFSILSYAVAFIAFAWCLSLLSTTNIVEDIEEFVTPY